MIDPFNGGGVLDEAALSELLKRTNYRQPFSREMLAPTPVRHVIARMLMNLRGIYAARADYPRLLLVIDRFLDLMPESTEELRDRGYLLARLGAAEAAVSDLEAYVDRLPHAGRVEGVHYSLAYAGHGVALATWLGARMGDALAGQGPVPTLAGELPPIPFYRGNPWFLPAVGGYYRMMDWIR